MNRTCMKNCWLNVWRMQCCLNVCIHFFASRISYALFNQGSPCTQGTYETILEQLCTRAWMSGELYILGFLFFLYFFLWFKQQECFAKFSSWDICIQARDIVHIKSLTWFRRKLFAIQLFLSWIKLIWDKYCRCSALPFMLQILVRFILGPVFWFSLHVFLCGADVYKAVKKNRQK